MTRLASFGYCESLSSPFISFSTGWYVTYPTTRPGVESVFSLFFIRRPGHSDTNATQFNLWATATRCGSATVAPLGRLQDGALLPRRDDLAHTTGGGPLVDSSAGDSDAPMLPRMVFCTYPDGLTWCQTFHECMMGSIPDYLQSFSGLPSFLQE